MDILWTND